MHQEVVKVDIFWQSVELFASKGVLPGLLVIHFSETEGNLLIGDVDYAEWSPVCDVFTLVIRVKVGMVQKYLHTGLVEPPSKVTLLDLLLE